MSEPCFVYDDCGFCTWWAEFFADHADLPIVGFSELDTALRERLPDDYETCSHLVTDGTVYSCGESIERALLRTDLGMVARPAVAWLRRFGHYRDVREWGYRRGANNRDIWDGCSRGHPLPRETIRPGTADATTPAGSYRP